jgi:outer membrane immunogenic protein
MKKLLFGSAAIVGLNMLGSALAADMPVKARPAPPVAEYNWSGCYVGGNVGWKQGRFRERADTAAGTATATGFAPVPFVADSVDLGRIRDSSGIAGGEAGCRWQVRDHWVVGLEGDFEWQNIRDSSVLATVGTGRSVFVIGDIFGVRSRWQSSVRGTVGYSWDRWLGYVTGGVAFTDVKMDANFIPTLSGGILFPQSFGSESKTLVGGTVGGGVSYALSQNWTLGAEYRYTAYKSEDFSLGTVAAICFNAVTCSATAATGHLRLRTQEVLLKLDYKLDWAGGLLFANN